MYQSLTSLFISSSAAYPCCSKSRNIVSFFPTLCDMGSTEFCYISLKRYFALMAHKYRYQNYITEESSKRVLKSIKPVSCIYLLLKFFHLDTNGFVSPLTMRFPQVLVLSGHDHDHCTVTHETSIGSILEVRRH